MKCCSESGCALVHEAAKQVYKQNEFQPNNYGLGIRTNAELGLSPLLPKTTFALCGRGLNVAIIVPDYDLIVMRTSRIASLDMQQFTFEFAERVAALIR